MRLAGFDRLWSAAAAAFGACLYRGGNSLCEGRRDRYACLAARFAAKEAVFKALGNGLAGCRWVDVEVCRTGRRQAQDLTARAAARLARENGIASVLISLSHSREHAVAFALAERGGLSLRVVTAEEMKALDRTAIEEYGISGLVLMENASRHVVEVVRQVLGDVRIKS